MLKTSPKRKSFSPKYSPFSSRSQNNKSISTINNNKSINKSKTNYKEPIYYRKHYPVELRESILDQVMNAIIKEEVVEEIFQHKVAKIFKQRILNKVMKQEIMGMLTEELDSQYKEIH